MSHYVVSPGAGPTVTQSWSFNW